MTRLRRVSAAPRCRGSGRSRATPRREGPPRDSFLRMKDGGRVGSGAASWASEVRGREVGLKGEGAGGRPWPQGGARRDGGREELGSPAAGLLPVEVHWPAPEVEVVAGQLPLWGGERRSWASEGLEKWREAHLPPLSSWGLALGQPGRLRPGNPARASCQEPAHPLPPPEAEPSCAPPTPKAAGPQEGGAGAGVGVSEGGERCGQSCSLPHLGPSSLLSWRLREHQWIRLAAPSLGERGGGKPSACPLRATPLPACLQ